MKLGVMLGYSGRDMALPIARVQRCEELGYDSVWTAEAYGSDAVTPLAFLAAHTTRIRLATGVIQVGARSPAMTAMQLGTLDQLAGGGRVIGGLGVSGPQIVEGWYGTPWGKPIDRLRDYVEIMNKIFAREGPVTHDGPEIQLPYQGPGAAGMGKPLKSILHFPRKPKVFLGTGARKSVSMTAEIADGWLNFGMRKGNVDTFVKWLEEGFARAGGDKGFHNFEIQGTIGVKITNDIKGAFASAKPNIALYVGGMGHPDLNFHKKRMTREGWGEAADRIQELFLAGKRQEAIDAVPDEYVDEGGLFGPPDRITARWRAQFEGLPFTGMTIQSSQDEAFELMAELVGTRDERR